MRGALTRIVALAITVVFSAAVGGCGSDTRIAESVMAPRPSVEVVETTASPVTVAPVSVEAIDATVPSTAATTTSTVPETTSTATAAPVTAAPVTAPPETTTTTTTTAVPTTAVEALPVPVPAPVDSRGKEPVIELGSIEIPKLGVSASMFEGIRLTTLDLGPGHWPGTASPGAVGNVVVAGHRTSHSKPFRHLDQLAPGDEVIFTTVDGRFVYNVVSAEIVTPDAIYIIDQTPEHTATLFACHPVGSTKERIVVHLALATA